MTQALIIKLFKSKVTGRIEERGGETETEREREREIETEREGKRERERDR